MSFIEKRRHPRRGLRFDPLERRALLSVSGDDPWLDPNSPNLPFVPNPILVSEYTHPPKGTFPLTPYTDPIDTGLGPLGSLSNPVVTKETFPHPVPGSDNAILLIANGAGPSYQAPGGTIAVPAAGTSSTASGAAVAGGTPVARFVDQVFIDSLGRAPTSSDLTFWSGIDRRFGPGFVARQVADSAEHRRYGADPPSATAATPFVAASPAGSASAGGSATTAVGTGTTSSRSFVTSLYADVLGRGPDAAGLTFWVDALDAGASPAAVRRAFLNSAEHRS